MSSTRLSRILLSASVCEPRELNRPVARNAAGIELTLRGFLAGTGAWRDAALRSGRRTAVLFSEDAAELLPALFGCWAAGLHVILPGDNLPGSLERLARSGLSPESALLGLEAVRMNEGSAWPMLAPEAAFEDFNALPVPQDLPELGDKTEGLSLLTSGSTGEAKLVRKRLEQAFYEPEAIRAGLIERTGAAPDAWGAFEVFSTVSAQHIYGLLFHALWPLMEPCGVAAGPRLHYPEALAKALEGCLARGRRAVIISSPSHLKRFSDPELFAPARSAIEAVFSSAGPLPESGALNARRAFGHFPFEVLGSTETGGIAWRQRALAPDALPEDADPKLLTPEWQTVEGIEAAVAVEGGYAASGTGLIALAGRHLEREGWIEGADRIALENGRFTLLGRADRVVKIEGKRVSLPEAEKLILETGLAAAVRVFLPSQPADDAAGRDRLAAVCVPTDAGRELLFAEGKTALTAALRRELARTLPAVAFPRRWRFADELPSNAQGKTPQALLEKLFDPRRPEWLAVSDEISESERTLTLRFHASPRLRWFEGHFPGMPILPGVAQLLLAEMAVREYCAVPGGMSPRLVRTLKFRSVTVPDCSLELILRMPRQLAPEGFRTAFEWRLAPSESASAASPQDGLIKSSGTLEWTAEA